MSESDVKEEKYVNAFDKFFNRYPAKTVFKVKEVLDKLTYLEFYRLMIDTCALFDVDMISMLAVTQAATKLNTLHKEYHRHCDEILEKYSNKD